MIGEKFYMTEEGIGNDSVIIECTIKHEFFPGMNQCQFDDYYALDKTNMFLNMRLMDIEGAKKFFNELEHKALECFQADGCNGSAYERIFDEKEKLLVHSIAGRGWTNTGVLHYVRMVNEHLKALSQ